MTTQRNLPNPTLTPNKDYDPTRHDVRVLHLRGRPLFDWDILHGREILKDQIGGLLDGILQDGAFLDGWKAIITGGGTTVTINPGKLKIGEYLVELYESEDRVVELVPQILSEYINDPSGLNADRIAGDAFQLEHGNLKTKFGVALHPSPIRQGSMADFVAGEVDFVVESSFDTNISTIDPVYGFITLDPDPGTESVYISYYYGRSGTVPIPAILYAEIEVVRIDGDESTLQDEFLRDDITEVIGAWRDKINVTFMVDDTKGIWDAILLDAMAVEGFGTTYFVFPIAIIIDGVITSDIRSITTLKTDVANFGIHKNLIGLLEDDHPQYLTVNKHLGVDHSMFFDSNKLSGITILNISGYSDRTVNVDTVQPRLVSAYAVDNTHIDANFSEGMDPVSVLITANYRVQDVDTGAILLSTLDSNILTQSSVRLTVSVQTNRSYRLVVSNVKDTFGNFIDSEYNNIIFTGKA